MLQLDTEGLRLLPPSSGELTPDDKLPGLELALLELDLILPVLILLKLDAILELDPKLRGLDPKLRGLDPILPDELDPTLFPELDLKLLLLLLALLKIHHEDFLSGDSVESPLFGGESELLPIEEAGVV